MLWRGWKSDAPENGCAELGNIIKPRVSRPVGFQAEWTSLTIEITDIAYGYKLRFCLDAVSALLRHLTKTALIQISGLVW